MMVYIIMVKLDGDIKMYMLSLMVKKYMLMDLGFVKGCLGVFSFECFLDFILFY